MGMDYYGPMPLSTRVLAASLLAVVSLAGVANAQNAAPPTPAASTAPATAEPNAGLDAELFYEIFLGEFAARSGDAGAGYALLLEAARRSNNEKLYQRATEIALQSRSGEPALAAARAWTTAWPRSQMAQRYLLQILLALNRTADTAAPLAQLLESTEPAARQSVVLSLPLLYRQLSDKALAARVVSEVLKPYFSDPLLGPAAMASSGRMQLLAGDRATALALAQEVAARAPDSDELASFALDLMEARVAGAETLVQQAFSGTRSPQLRMTYARVLLERQQYAAAQAQIETVTQQHPELAQAWLALAALQVQNGDLDAGQTSLDRFSKSAAGMADSPEKDAATTQTYVLQSEIAEKRGQLDEAEAWLARIDNADARFDVQVRRATLLARRGKLSHARALLQSLPEETPEDKQRKLAAQVQLLRDNGQYADAYALQGELVREAPGDADLLYDHAMLAEKTGDRDTMERLLRQIIAAKPDYHHAYNALGYSFADRGIRLAEARSLVETALRLAPGDPFITDSLAWVEFRAGNKARALELLASAFAARKDPEIAAHYGEVLWATGDHERARAVWREGLRRSADNATLLETLKRLGVTP